MTEYLRELERRKPGDDMPPINLGPYDNPLLWNMLDPYGADRGHQRRPSSLSRSFLELHNVPLVMRDSCAHRLLPYLKCLRNQRGSNIAYNNCMELEHAGMLCRMKERYRAVLLKTKFLEMTADYTEEDKRFFPNTTGAGPWVHQLQSHYWGLAGAARLSGWDENDPANPMMWNQPNRALMRTEFSPTNFEQSAITHALFEKELPAAVMLKEVPGFSLPEDKRPH